MGTKRVMDDEMRRKLAGLLPFAPGSFIEYTPEAFNRVPEEFRPKFLLGPISPKVQADAKKKTKEGGDPREAAVEVLKNGTIVGWENLVDFVNGNTVAFTKEAIDTLTDHVVWALYNKAAELAGLTELEKEVLE